MSAEDNQGSQLFNPVSVEKYNVVGEEDYQNEIVQKRTRSDGTISEHEIKAKFHDETLKPVSQTTTPQRAPSPERVSKSSGRSTPRRSLSPRKLDTTETKTRDSSTAKSRRSVSPQESVHTQTRTANAPPPPPKENYCPPLLDDYPPPQTFDSHRDLRRADYHQRPHPCHDGPGNVCRTCGNQRIKDPCHVVPRGRDNETGGTGNRAGPDGGPNWFVLYGTDYGPVLVSKEHLQLCEEKAEDVADNKEDSIASGPFTPMLTADSHEYGPYAGNIFDGMVNPREVAVICDRENKYREALSKPTYHDASSSVSSCLEVGPYGGLRIPKRPVTTTIQRRKVEVVNGREDSEDISEGASANKPCRNIERLTARMCDLETQVSCLAAEKAMLCDKLTQATLMINEITQKDSSPQQKCTNTDPNETNWNVVDDSDFCLKTDADTRKADRIYISGQKKVVELQSEIRELKLELKHLNEERMKFEMQQRQDERCKNELYEEVEATRRLEQEMKAGFQFLERQHQRDEDEVQSTRVRLATLIHTINPDCKPMVDVLLKESTKTLQCMLEKLVSSTHMKYVQKRNELDDTLEELRRVKAAVNKAESVAQGNSLKVQCLKEKLRMLKDSMNSSVTDLTGQVRSKEKDLDCAQERLQDLMQRCSEKEELATASQTRLEQLEDQLHILEVERDRCLQHVGQQRNKCKQRVDRLKDKYKNKVGLMERLRDACHNCDSLRFKVLQLQYDEEKDDEGQKLPSLLSQLERTCKEATNVMDSLQQAVRSRDDSDISLCKKRLDDLDGKVCKVASDCSINQSKTPALHDLSSRLNDALKLIEILRANANTNNQLKKRSWTNCHLAPRAVKAVASSTNTACCRAVERSSDDKAAAVQQHMARAQAWAQNILQSCRNASAPPYWSSPSCPPPPGFSQTPICTVIPPSPIFYNNYPYPPFCAYPTPSRSTAVPMPAATVTASPCNFLENDPPPCEYTGYCRSNQDETPTTPTMAYQLSTRTIGIAKHDMVFPTFTKNSP